MIPCSLSFNTEIQQEKQRDAPFARCLSEETVVSSHKRESPTMLNHTTTIIALSVFCLLSTDQAAADSGQSAHAPFPPPLESYGDGNMVDLLDVLANRVEKGPLNLWATALFLGALVHSFMTHRFRHLAHELAGKHAQRVRDGVTDRLVSVPSKVLHFLGEIEAVFGIWVLPLIVVMNATVGGGSTLEYIEERVNFAEAVFVVVIMTIASTRPILMLAENTLRVFARLGKETPIAWWLSIMLIGPLLGSLITEPAAMTICALLLSEKFYSCMPSRLLAYGSLGLLFVAISIGGTLTHFAAPPVLMVVDAWGWDTPHMITQFGWKATVAIILSVLAYYFVFRKDFRRLQPNSPAAQQKQGPIHVWVTGGHLLFMVIAVMRSHEPTSLIFVLLFFLAFVEVTEDFQKNFTLRPPILVGFFLAGLVIHGGLQQWWIAPVLGRLGELPLMLGATVLTAFNDNAAITYLCTLVPTLTEELKYAAVAGAVAGGGLTVIANAPNPAGVSILMKHFDDGVSAAGLAVGAIAPTIIAVLCFLLL